MSIVTLKRKARHIGNLSHNKNCFSINGKERNNTYIGKHSLFSSKSCCSSEGNTKSVLNTKGMIANKYRREKTHHKDISNNTYSQYNTKLKYKITDDVLCPTDTCEL